MTKEIKKPEVKADEKPVEEVKKPEVKVVEEKPEVKADEKPVEEVKKPEVKVVEEKPEVKADEKKFKKTYEVAVTGFYAFGKMFRGHEKISSHTYKDYIEKWLKEGKIR